jgi:hypothetical protein
MTDYLSYQKSIAGELIAVKDRVRNFTQNWGEDGRYKEIIFANVLQRALPNIAKVGTGFVIGKNNEVTRQIDIIVYDRRYPMFFQKDNFIIAPAESVFAIIEVKTRAESDNIIKAIQNALYNGRIIEDSVDSGSHIFNGIFSYETDFTFDRPLPESIKNILKENGGYLNYMTLGKDIFMRRYGQCQHRGNNPEAHYSFYKIEDLAFGYFISNLVEDIYIRVHNASIKETSLSNYLYPIEGTKEAHILLDF